MRLKILLVLSLSIIWTGCAQENRYDFLQGKTLDEVREFYPPPDSQTAKLGIAFGGGGVRGFVHLGVIQALVEAGIDAEIVTGNSIMKAGDRVMLFAQASYLDRLTDLFQG